MIFITAIVVTIVSFLKMNYSIILSYFNKIEVKDILNAVMDFLSSYMWGLLFLAGMLVIIYRFLKDRYTNKIMNEIQDEELKEIINLHKDLYGKFLKLRQILCDNVYTCLISSKNKGTFYALGNFVGNRYSGFTYNYTKGKIELEEKKKKLFYKYHYDIGYILRRYKGIKEICAEIDVCIESFQKKDIFYSSAAIGKYAKGLKGINIIWMYQIYNQNDLLCRELVEKIFEIPENTDSVIKNEIYDNEKKMEILNKELQWKNMLVIDAVISTIEYVQVLQKYLEGIEKLFALKTRRKEISPEPFMKK